MAALLVSGATASNASTDGGTLRWSAGYGQQKGAYSMDLALAPDESTVYVTGTSRSPDGQMTTLAYNSETGTRLWSAITGASDSEPGRGNTVVVSPDGSTVFAGGYTLPDGPLGDVGPELWRLVAYDAKTGDVLWDRQRAITYLTHMVVIPDGSLLVVNGASDGGTGNLSAISTSTGRVVWSVDLPESGVGEGALQMSPDGTTVYRVSSDDSDAACGALVVRAFDVADGSVHWVQGGDDGEKVCSAPRASALSPDGARLVVLGRSNSRDGGADYPVQLLAYDTASGTLEPGPVLPEMPAPGSHTNFTVLPAADGTVVVNGSRRGVDGSAVGVTLSVDLVTGSRLWTSELDTGSPLYAGPAVGSPDGSTVYVANSAHVSCWLDCAADRAMLRTLGLVVAYDRATGRELWVRRHLDDDIIAMKVGPRGGGVYLAGSFTAASESLGRTGVARRGATCSSRCGVSVSATNTGVGRARVEDVDASLDLGGWRTTYLEGAIGGSYRSSATKGDTVSIDTPADTVVRWVVRRGPDMGRARVVIDGQDKGMVDLYAPSPTRASYLFDGLDQRRHRVVIRVMGRKSASSTGTRVAVDAFRMKWHRLVVDETSPHLRYGSWVGVGRSLASGGTVRRSSTVGAAASLRFSGRSVRWITATGPGLGKARVIVDGVGRTIDLYAARVHDRVPVAFTGLGGGEHRIVVRPLGTRNRASRGTAVVVDAFDVRP